MNIQILLRFCILATSKHRTDYLYSVCRASAFTVQASLIYSIIIASLLAFCEQKSKGQSLHKADVGVGICFVELGRAGAIVYGQGWYANPVFVPVAEALAVLASLLQVQKAEIPCSGTA